ncbi:nucleoside-diphosphate-sugar epimerase [Salinibacter ruber]|nr:NAD-dependent epimerase/dehydratase family protein [Salinibacter ruber]MCS3748870.1 nucleoside-diphosphate-sugar epimerase [Salinibacter ruber]
METHDGMRKLLVTGSSGLIGSEVVDYFCRNGWFVYGIDNNIRAEFFGEDGDTRWDQRRLESQYGNFTHVELDIRNRSGILNYLDELRPDAILHTAAQPSHDKEAAGDPAGGRRTVCAKGTVKRIEGGSPVPVCPTN